MLFATALDKPATYCNKDGEAVLELTKDFQMITLNVKEMKKVLEDLKFLESENWELPF